MWMAYRNYVRRRFNRDEESPAQLLGIVPRRMRPEDRLYVQWRANEPPPIPGLDWFQPVYILWAGRLPREGSTR